MANFRTFADGFVPAFNAGQNRQVAQRQMAQQRQAKQEEAAAKSLQKRITDSETSSLGVADQMIQVATEAFKNGATLEQVAPVVTQGAFGALKQHAALLDEIQAMQMQSGLVPKGEPTAGAEFLKIHGPRIQAALSLGQIQPEEESDAPNVANFIDPKTGNASLVGVDLNAPGAQEEIAALTEQGFVRTGLNIQTDDASSLAPPLTSRTTSNLQESLINSAEGLARLSEVQRTFEPEFLTVGGKIKGFVTQTLDKINPDALTDEQKGFLDRYSTFAKTAFDNINRYIKEITGAQMSEFEADRLRKGIPDPERDSPRQFQAKMNQSVRELKLARARATYLIKNNLGVDALPGEGDEGKPGKVSIGDIERIIENRFEELTRLGMSQEDADDQIREEFGF